MMTENEERQGAATQMAATQVAQAVRDLNAALDAAGKLGIRVELSDVLSGTSCNSHFHIARMEQVTPITWSIK